MRIRVARAAAALALVPLAFACSKKSYPTAGPSPIDSTRTPNPPPAAASVVIKDFSYSPATLTVAKGTAVKWTNSGPSTHTVTSATFDSGNIAAPGGTFIYTFTTPGTYGYHCSIHPNMTGSITVTQ